MITADQIAVHLVGDYLTQSDWMAQGKTKHWWPALCHAFVYSLGFLVLSPSWHAWAVIFTTHYFIDRYRLARYLVWGKNWLGARRWWSLAGETWTVADVEPSRLQQVTGLWWHAPTPPLRFCPTGYPPTTPVWLSMWLMVIGDNVVHILVNGAAMRWL